MNTKQQPPRVIDLQSARESAQVPASTTRSDLAARLAGYLLSGDQPQSRSSRRAGRVTSKARLLVYGLVGWLVYSQAVHLHLVVSAFARLLRLFF